jgi:hypothetical protein
VLSCMKAVFTFNAMQSRKRRRRAPSSDRLDAGERSYLFGPLTGLSPQKIEDTNSDFIAAFGFSGFDPTPSHSTL